jgi:transcriptional regulator with XRE-family HTH domain
MAGRRIHAEFAGRLRLALDEAGFGKASSKELARKFGITPQALRKWLEGEAMPVSGRAAGIAEILQVRRAWLFDNELPMRAFQAAMAELPSGYRADADTFSISGEELRLLNHYRSLSRPVQDSLRSLLESMQARLTDQNAYNDHD